jgi:hypothetical protein
MRRFLTHLLALAVLAFGAAAFAQDSDINNNKKDIRQDKRDLNKDRKDIKQDPSDLNKGRADRKESQLDQSCKNGNKEDCERVRDIRLDRIDKACKTGGYTKDCDAATVEHGGTRTLPVIEARLDRSCKNGDKEDCKRVEDIRKKREGKEQKDSKPGGGGGWGDGGLGRSANVGCKVSERCPKHGR